jgi:triosephosphate isomerase
MRRPLVVGNWKMNGTSASAATLLREVLDGLGNCKAAVGVCAPFVYIPQVAQIIGDRPLLIGAQNVADQASGAYTGEISPAMLKEFGCQLAIVGHSERRALYGESDQLVAARYKQSIEGGVTPILCIGETLDEREQGKTLTVIDSQLDAVFSLAGVDSLAHAVIAYEPVWAIGTGRTATSEQAQEVHQHIRTVIGKQNAAVAAKVQILYGGSVKPDNAAELFGMPDIDGGLIGGASLDAKSFLAICHAA